VQNGKVEILSQKNNKKFQTQKLGQGDKGYLLLKKMLLPQRREIPCLLKASLHHLKDKSLKKMDNR
jgi:hypothetical protein